MSTLPLFLERSAEACPNGRQLRGLGAFQVRVHRHIDTDAYIKRFGRDTDLKAAIDSALAESQSLTRMVIRELRRRGIKRIVDAQTSLRIPCLTITVSDTVAEGSLREYVRAQRAHADEIPATTWSARSDEGDSARELAKSVAWHFAVDYNAGVRGFLGP